MAVTKITRTFTVPAPKVLGVDPSTNTGWALLEGDKHTVGLIHDHAKARGFQRSKTLKQKLVDLLEQHQPALVMIENYAFSNANSLALMVEIGTLYREALWDLGIPYIEVPPNSMKMYVTGSGTAKKEQILLMCYKRWGVEFQSNDIADAYCLAKMGQRLLAGPGEHDTLKMREALTKLDLAAQPIGTRPSFSSMYARLCL